MMAKYRNQRIAFGGILFDSKAELFRWHELIAMERSEKISDLQRQVSYPLRVNGILVCRYVADFVYTIDGKTIVEDVKSSHTAKLPVYRLKKKLMKAILGVEIREFTV